jgi:hypothetical protein
VSATPGTGNQVPVRVRAANGIARDDGWVRTIDRPLLARLGEGGLLALGGTAVGILLLPIPLVHLFGAIFALFMWWLGIRRAGTRTVVLDAGGVCPRCGERAAFYVGFGRQRFRLPLSTSCPRCSRALSLEPLPGSAPGRD